MEGAYPPRPSRRVIEVAQGLKKIDILCYEKEYKSFAFGTGPPLCYLSSRSDLSLLLLPERNIFSYPLGKGLRHKAPPTKILTYEPPNLSNRVHIGKPTPRAVRYFICLPARLYSCGASRREWTS